MDYWNNKKITITGGAALIGSHLAEYLFEQGAGRITIIDDLSSGRKENLSGLPVELFVTDLRNYPYTRQLIKNSDVVFHLACAHGGRSWVDTHYLESYQNLELDATVFRACRDNVGKVIYMSSACAYPMDIQANVNADIRLSEDLVNYNNTKQADGAYGMTKLMGEITLDTYYKEAGLDMAIIRGFTVYGPRMKENHAVLALIAKSLTKQTPFQIFGDGKQKRNWTFVKDTVAGIALVAENISGKAVNIGTEEVNTPNSLCEIIWEELGWRPDNISYSPGVLVGAANRIADATLAKLIGWQPKYTLTEGVKETIEWYLETHSMDEINKFQERMFER